MQLQLRVLLLKYIHGMFTADFIQIRRMTNILLHPGMLEAIQFSRSLALPSSNGHLSVCRIRVLFLHQGYSWNFLTCASSITCPTKPQRCYFGCSSASRSCRCLQWRIQKKGAWQRIIALMLSKLGPSPAKTSSGWLTRAGPQRNSTRDY